MIPRNYSVTVEGVGDFVFRKREVRDQIWIESDAFKTVGAAMPAKPSVPNDMAEWSHEDRANAAAFVAAASLWDIATAIATLDRLTVKAPPAWNVAEVDPLDDSQVEPIRVVYRSLRDAEERFRQGVGPQRESAGA